MNHFYIYQNEVKIEEVIVTTDTQALDVLGAWLDDNGFEGKYEMIQTNDDGNYYAETEQHYFELKNH